MAVGEAGASGNDVLRCMSGVCKGSVAGGEGRFCRESEAEGGGASGKDVARGPVRACGGGVAGGDIRGVSRRVVAVVRTGGASCAV